MSSIYFPTILNFGIVTDMEIEKTSKSFELAKEFLGKMVEVSIDRPIGTRHPEHGFEYKVNYGYIHGFKAPDGKDLDAYVLAVDEPVQSKIGVCIAIAHRNDDDDDKLIVVPEGVTMSDAEIMSAINFQEQWFETVIIRSDTVIGLYLPWPTGNC